MPFLQGFPVQKDEIGDPDRNPRPVVTYGLTDNVASFELDHHRHVKAQLVFVRRGLMTCEVESGFWPVPPQCALWIPADALHAIKASGVIEGYNAFIDPAAGVGLPAECCTVSVSPLLRELLIRAASFPVDYPLGGYESRVHALLLEEIAAAPVRALHLRMPDDPRLRRLAEMMIADPADRGTAAIWARRAGFSERTLARLLQSQTGLSFGRWRQQLLIVLALQRMAEGSSVQRVAADLGYESAGSFVTMFRKALGTSPRRYMSLREDAPLAA